MAAIKAEPDGPPRVPVVVSGGVLNYCDPQRFKEVAFPSDRAWKVAVGIHPKHAPKVDDRMLDDLESLICDTRVAGVSELGLDHSTPPDTWVLQEHLLDRIVRMGVSGRVLVVHVRGERADPYGEVVHPRVRDILKRRCNRYQRVQVHCTSTTSQQVRAWLLAFPHAYFSFGRMVRLFDQAQLKALQLVPRTRLLLETDAPYFGRGASVHTSAYLGEVAQLVASARRESLESVVMYSRYNALRLYREESPE